MTPVITAIVAAILAGGIALYRERRIELIRLLVSARVTQSMFNTGQIALKVLAEFNPTDDAEGWALLDMFVSLLAVPSTWSEHRNTLAAHLDANQWRQLSVAATTYMFTTTNVERDKPFVSAHTEFAKCQQDLARATEIIAPFCVEGGWWRNPGKRDRKTKVVAHERPSS